MIYFSVEPKRDPLGSFARLATAYNLGLVLESHGLDIIERFNRNRARLGDENFWQAQQRKVGTEEAQRERDNVGAALETNLCWMDFLLDMLSPRRNWLLARPSLPSVLHDRICELKTDLETSHEYSAAGNMDAPKGTNNCVMGIELFMRLQRLADALYEKLTLEPSNFHGGTSDSTAGKRYNYFSRGKARLHMEACEKTAVPHPRRDDLSLIPLELVLPLDGDQRTAVFADPRYDAQWSLVELLRKLAIRQAESDALLLRARSAFQELTAAVKQLPSRDKIRRRFKWAATAGKQQAIEEQYRRQSNDVASLNIECDSICYELRMAQAHLACARHDVSTAMQGELLQVDWLTLICRNNRFVARATESEMLRLIEQTGDQHAVTGSWPHRCLRQAYATAGRVLVLRAFDRRNG